MRIAGATDLREKHGVGGSDIIQARGRWGSDIHFIYERVTAVEMLDASRTMGEAHQPEAEVVLGRPQDARRRGWR